MRPEVMVSVMLVAACAGPLPVTTAKTGAVLAAAPAAEAPRQIEAALALVEQGRVVQRDKGEDGATAAVALYEQALAADPYCAAARWELGWSLQTLSRFDDALAHWDRLRALDPAYPELAVHYPVLVLRRQQAAALAALPEPGQLAAPEEVPRGGPTLRVKAVGDIQMGRAWPARRATLPPHNAADLLAAVADNLHDADLTFGNLETALADEGDSAKCAPKSTKCFSFRVPTSFARALADAGFDVLSIANNHAGDFGEAGRASTMQALDGAGLRHSGPVGDIASLEVNGLRVGLVAFSTGQVSYRIQDIDIARRVVADVDRAHDLVIVSFHGGAEGVAAAHVPKEREVFYGEDRGDVYAFAHAVVDAGADLALGHGPHLLRAMEIYRGRLIAYSLGNFSTWDTFSLKDALGISAILEVTLAANGVVTAARLHPLFLQDPGRPRPDPEQRAIESVRRLSQEDLGSPLFDTEGVYTRAAPVSQR